MSWVRAIGGRSTNLAPLATLVCVGLWIQACGVARGVSTEEGRALEGKAASVAEESADDSWTAVVEMEEEFLREIHIAPTAAIDFLQSYRASLDARWFVIREGVCSEDKGWGPGADCDYCYEVEYHSTSYTHVIDDTLLWVSMIRIDGYRFHGASVSGESRRTQALPRFSYDFDLTAAALRALGDDAARAVDALFSLEGEDCHRFPHTRAYLSSSAAGILAGETLDAESFLEQLRDDRPEVWGTGTRKDTTPCLRAKCKTAALLPSVLVGSIELFARPDSDPYTAIVTPASDLTQLRADCAEDLPYPILCDGFWDQWKSWHDIFGAEQLGGGTRAE